MDCVLSGPCPFDGQYLIRTCKENTGTLNVCSPSVDAKTTHHRKGPAAGVSDSHSGLVIRQSQCQQRRQALMKGSMNCCYGDANAKGYFVLCCFDSAFGLQLVNMPSDQQVTFFYVFMANLSFKVLCCAIFEH